MSPSSIISGLSVLQLRKCCRKNERLWLHPDPGRCQGHRPGVANKLQHLRKRSEPAPGHHLQEEVILSLLPKHFSGVFKRASPVGNKTFCRLLRLLTVLVFQPPWPPSLSTSAPTSSTFPPRRPASRENKLKTMSNFVKNMSFLFHFLRGGGVLSWMFLHTFFLQWSRGQCRLRAGLLHGQQRVQPRIHRMRRRNVQCSFLRKAL